MTEKKKKNHIPVLIAFFVLFLAGILVVLVVVKGHFSYGTDYMDPYAYFEAENDGRVLIIQNRTIEEAKATLIDGEPYASYDYIRLNLSPAVYWDQESQTILYTTEAGTESIAPGGSEVKVGENGKILISLAYAAERSGLTCAYYENPSRVVLRSKGEKRVLTTAAGETQLRYRAGVKSEILKDIPVGEELEILDTLDDWLHVSSEDGFTGYVPEKYMGEQRVVPVEIVNQRSFTPIHLDTKVNLIWHQTTSLYSNAAFSEVSADMTGINVVSPTWFSVLDNTGLLDTNNSQPYVEEVHARGMKIWGLVDNFNPNFNTEKALASASVRSFLIQQLIQEALATGLDGINVDFESLSEGAIAHYIQFLRELTAAAHPYGLIISVDTSVPQSYTAYYHRGIQGSIVDYMIMMGYDEHYAGSEEAGSVASLPFVRDGIEELIREGIEPSNIVCGIPFYTRLWTTSQGDGSVSSEVKSMDEADEEIASRGMSKEWNEQCGQYVAAVEANGAKLELWMEEEESITRKTALIREYGLAGCASWKIGFERPTVWAILEQAIQ